MVPVVRLLDLVRRSPRTSGRDVQAATRLAALPTRLSVAVVCAAMAITAGPLPPPAMAAAMPVLAVSVVGPGSISSRPSGIACPGRCSATFAAGTRVVLSPGPRAGSSFLRWGGACTGSGQCTVTIGSLVAVAAQFLPGPAPQPAAKTVAVPGSYTARGAPYVYGAFSFSVAPGGSKLLNVSVPVAGPALGCTPSGLLPAPSSIVVPQVAVRPDGTFAVSLSGHAPYDNTTAKFTYDFAGSFEGVAPPGAETVAGSLREDISFTAHGAAETCTTNLRPWSAVRTS